MTGQNRYGQSLDLCAHGFLARVFQHEVDHLDGILFTDRAVRIVREDELDAQQSAK